MNKSERRTVMSGNVKLLFSISKDAAKSIKNGSAVLSSGGVRSLNGELLELAKPAAQSFINGGTSPIGLASSLANNVQSGFIQHGVNQANQKLNVSLEKIDQIQAAVSRLATSQALSWLNCAFGMANCAISIVGFAITFKKLSNIQKEIALVANKLDEQQKNDFLERFYRYWLYINDDISILTQYQMSPKEADTIREHIDEITAFIARVIKQVRENTIDKMFGLAIAINLSSAFAKLVSEYAAQYYYENGKFPANYDYWVGIIYEMRSDAFAEEFKKFLIYERNDLSYEERMAGYSALVYTIEKEVSDIEMTKQVVMLLEKKDYINIDEYIKNKILKGDYFENNQYACIPLGN